MTVIDATWEVWERARRGELELVRTFGARSGAWGAAFAALGHNLLPQVFPRVREESPAPAGEGAGPYVSQLAHRALVSNDVAALAHATKQAERLEVAAPLAICKAGHAYLVGGELASVVDVEDTLSLTNASGDTAALAELVCLRALDAAESGRLEDAVRDARRAARMARTEGLLQQEYLAAIALARVRRLTHRPHVAARILSALGVVAPPVYRPWIGRELVLCGRAPLDEDAVWTALRAAVEGRRPEFEEARLCALEEVRDVAPARSDAELLFRLVDPASAATEAWTRGDDLSGPRGLYDPGASGHPPHVLVGAGDARRLLGAGVSLARAAGAEVIGPEARTASALSVLALASHGSPGEASLSRSALFRAVYGFELTPGRHDGVLRTLLHRVRAALGDAGDVVTADDRVVLRARRALSFRDPRCELPPDERILALVATGQGRITAREVAHALKLPLRRVQKTLGELVERGECESVRQGRRVEYTVEDTTFAEPSLHRLRPG